MTNQIGRQPAFDRKRGMMEGLPGFQANKTMVRDVTQLAGMVSTYVIETVRTQEEWALFLEAITEEGTVRMFVPDKVLRAIYRHRDAIIAKGRKIRAKQVAAERKAAGVIPFQRKAESQ